METIFLEGQIHNLYYSASIKKCLTFFFTLHSVSRVVVLKLVLRSPRGVRSDVLTKSQQLSIIKVTIDIRVLKVYIA